MQGCGRWCSSKPCSPSRPWGICCTLQSSSRLIAAGPPWYGQCALSNLAPGLHLWLIAKMSKQRTFILVMDWMWSKSKHYQHARHVMPGTWCQSRIIRVDAWGNVRADSVVFTAPLSHSDFLTTPWSNSNEFLSQFLRILTAPFLAQNLRIWILI